MRVVAGVGAWLLGVGAATAGSLLAVSLLGQGIATSTSQQWTESAVQRALHAEATETLGADPAPTGAPSPTLSAAPSHQARVSQVAQEIEATPSAPASRSRAASSPSPQATATPSSTVLSSQGGTVVADCRPAGAYLVSWSPTPGYEVGTVTRGPAMTARVIFSSAANTVTMMVSCSAGVPTATSTISGSGSGGGWNDGGGGGE
jgi:serine/threonine-protein kinase